MNNQDFNQMKHGHTLLLWIQECQRLADERHGWGAYFNSDDALPILCKILNHKASSAAAESDRQGAGK